MELSVLCLKMRLSTKRRATFKIIQRILNLNESFAHLESRFAEQYWQSFSNANQWLVTKSKCSQVSMQGSMQSHFDGKLLNNVEVIFRRNVSVLLLECLSVNTESSTTKFQRLESTLLTFQCIERSMPNENIDWCSIRGAARYIALSTGFVVVNLKLKKNIPEVYSGTPLSLLGEFRLSESDSMKV